MRTLLDDVLAMLLICAFAPVFLAIILALTFDPEAEESSIIFRQMRSGLHGQPFTIFKFRTMVHGVRMTKCGAFLRRWSLDELPQLLNVLRGEMAFVGPRPTLPEQVARYTPYQRQRLMVKPGITGLAQISGRNALAWIERIELDIRYVQRRSLWLDLQILWRTLFVWGRRKGLTGPGGINDDFGATS